jgi:hypothetical protein
LCWPQTFKELFASGSPLPFPSFSPKAGAKVHPFSELASSFFIFFSSFSHFIDCQGENFSFYGLNGDFCTLLYIMEGFLLAKIRDLRGSSHRFSGRFFDISAAAMSFQHGIDSGSHVMPTRARAVAGIYGCGYARAILLDIKPETAYRGVVGSSLRDSDAPNGMKTSPPPTVIADKDSQSHERKGYALPLMPEHHHTDNPYHRPQRHEDHETTYMILAQSSPYTCGQVCHS